MGVIIFMALLVEFGAAFCIYFSTVHFDGKKPEPLGRVVFGEVLAPAPSRASAGSATGGALNRNACASRVKEFAPCR